MKMLNKLLPNKLPTAISIAPILIAATETATSGSEVDAANKTVPVNDLSVRFDWKIVLQSVEAIMRHQ